MRPPVSPASGAVRLRSPSRPARVKGGQATGVGVVHGTTVEITLQGRTPQKVLVTGMRVTVTKRSTPPTTGILVGYGQCGGGVDERHFDLDLSYPTATWKARPEKDDFTGEVVKESSPTRSAPRTRKSSTSVSPKAAHRHGTAATSSSSTGSPTANTAPPPSTTTPKASSATAPRPASPPTSSPTPPAAPRSPRSSPAHGCGLPRENRDEPQRVKRPARGATAPCAASGCALGPRGASTPATRRW